eukprot:356018-Chlamydomonas_euryale.AAC.1
MGHEYVSWGVSEDAPPANLGAGSGPLHIAPVPHRQQCTQTPTTCTCPVPFPTRTTAACNLPVRQSTPRRPNGVTLAPRLSPAYALSPSLLQAHHRPASSSACVLSAPPPPVTGATRHTGRFSGPMRSLPHALPTPCAPYPMRSLPHALPTPCAPYPMRSLPHALPAPCAPCPMRSLPHALPAP